MSTTLEVTALDDPTLESMSLFLRLCPSYTMALPRERRLLVLASKSSFVISPPAPVPITRISFDLLKITTISEQVSPTLIIRERNHTDVDLHIDEISFLYRSSPARVGNPVCLV